MKLIRTSIVAALVVPMLVGCVVKGRGFGSASQRSTKRERICGGFGDHRAPYTGPVGTVTLRGGSSTADALLFRSPEHSNITVTKLVAKLQKVRKDGIDKPYKEVVLVNSPTEVRRGQYLSFNLGAMYSIGDVVMEYKGGQGPKRGSRNVKIVSRIQMNGYCCLPGKKGRAAKTSCPSNMKQLPAVSLPK